jgi:phage shock protein A
MNNQTIQDTASELVAAMKDVAHVRDTLEHAQSKLSKLEAVAVAEGLPGSNAEIRKANLAAMYPELREEVKRLERILNSARLTLDICQVNWDMVKWTIRNNQNATAAQLDEVLATIRSEQVISHE